MRFALYNIRYGTGGKRLWAPWSGYFRRTSENLRNITGFLRSIDPDIVGLIEVDAGSYRSGRTNQATFIAESLDHYHTYRSKYADTGFAQFLPIMNKQGNAFLSRDTIANAQFHYFDQGVKRLVIELELENLVIFLVHLAVSFRARQSQLGDLYDLVRDTPKPHIVAGDFNSLWGDREMALFLAATRLANANRSGQPSFPSWAPRRQLDFILHSPQIRVSGLDLPQVTFSDHLPLVCDFQIES